MTNLKKLVALSVLIAIGGAAQADSLLDSSTYGALDGQSNVTVNGVHFTSAGGAFGVKSVNGWSGLGVRGGGSGNEIDVGESITMSFASQVIAGFTVSLLYNGPEFGDYREIAQVGAYSGDTFLGNFDLTVGLDGSSPGAAWSGLSGSVANLSLPDASHGAAWAVTGNPFGNNAVTSLVFTAKASNLCQSNSCSNQSDYVLTSVAAVPEPGTYALMAAGLGALGFVARRRRPQA